MKSDIIRLSVSLPQNLLRKLDERITHRGYSSRSELVRDLIRERLNDEAWSGGDSDFGTDSQAVAVLTIVYDHHQRELNARMIDIQHSSTHEGRLEILCNTHVHLNHHNCLETIIVRGAREVIEGFALEIGGLKGVKFSKLTRAGSFDADE